VRALADPCRLEIVLRLGQCGEQDIEAISEGFAQDRSGISRHLSALHAAGVLTRRQEGRRVLYRVDGGALLDRLEALTESLRAALSSCCPPKRRTRSTRSQRA
jgi:DNA-binding transcriptional ArsR family regulator